MTNISQISIDISAVKEPDQVVDAVMRLRMKLDKILDAFQHTVESPNYNYQITYTYKGQGSAVTVRHNDLSSEGSDLTARLLDLQVSELLDMDSPCAQIVLGTLDYVIDEYLVGGRAIIAGSQIRYYDQSSRSGRNQVPSWKNLTDDVMITVLRFEMTTDDIKEFRERQVKSAIESLKNSGFSLEDGVITV